MTQFSKPSHIKTALHQSLDVLNEISDCTVLDYPNYPNIGDHLIWIGTIFYLNLQLKLRIRYVSSFTEFSADEMSRKAGKTPILLQGGGNLGDLWQPHQKFRESIISTYKDRPIFILPQTIYFQKDKNIKRVADIFNSHPNLTIFTRDNLSYDLAQTHFSDCRVIKSPDMFFQMIGTQNLPTSVKPQDSILYFCRQDLEFNKQFAPESLGLPNLVIEDWVSFNWMVKAPDDWPFYIPGTVRLIREGWQRGLAAHPGEFLSRIKWNYFHTYSKEFAKMDQPNLHRRSWSMMHAGMYQLLQHRLVITNRLHGHLLCTCLGIPHVFLPNSYYKNELFYETWTQGIPFCRFVKEPEMVKPAVEELLKQSDEVPG